MTRFLQFAKLLLLVYATTGMASENKTENSVAPATKPEAVAVATGSTAAAQTPATIPDPEDRQLFYLTTRIHGKSSTGRQSVGTGFYYSAQISENRQVPMIVTCRHVLEGIDSAKFSFVPKKDDKPVLGESYEFEFHDIQKGVHFNSDPKIDVAVVPLVPILEGLESKGKNMYFKNLAQQLIPDAAAAAQLSSIHPVIFIGYPNGIWDEKNGLPIARRGVSATPFHIDYNGLPVFLIDAMTFGGSSGSPVLVYDNGAFSTSGGFTVGTRLYFLGMVSQAYIRDEEGEVRFRATPAATVPVYTQRTYLNLGVVLKPKAILDTIDEFLTSKKLK